MLEIKKFMVSLKTSEKGKIDLGKYTFFTIFPLSTITHVDLLIVVEKKPELCYNDT